MGFSWGGFESLCIHVHPEKNRSATPWTPAGPMLRIHAGLEDEADLIADLEHAFGAMNSIRG
jgi:cystathionine beta-lyase